MKRSINILLMTIVSLLVIGCADAGKNQKVHAGESVILDGSHSSSTYGKIISYQWEQVRGKGVTIDGKREAKATFIAPTVKRHRVLVFRLKVKERVHGYIIVSFSRVRIAVLPKVEPEVDTTAPVISIIGENPTTINIGDTYIEKGATAYDNVDGNLTQNITISSDLNTTKAGQYRVIYSVSDSHGNTATLSRVVIVNEVPDTIKPVITLLGEATVALTVGESYTDAGATATDDKDGDISANIVTTGSVDTATAGTYTISYNVKDAAGNDADTVTRTVTVNEVTVNVDISNWIRTNPGAGGAFSMIGATKDGTLVAGSDLSGVYIRKTPNSDWVALGENNNLLDTSAQALAFDPNDEKIFYVGTTNGVYQTKDKGEHFSLITNDRTVFPDPKVNGLIIESMVTANNRIFVTYHTWAQGNDDNNWTATAPNNPSEIASGIMDGAGNISWSKLPALHIPFLYIEKLLISDNGNTLYALSGNTRYGCSPATVYRYSNATTNSGTWVDIGKEAIDAEMNRLDFSDSNSTIGILDIALSKSEADTLYLTTFNPNKCPYELNNLTADNTLGMHDYVKDAEIGNVYTYNSANTPSTVSLADDKNITGIIVSKEDGLSVINVVKFESIWISNNIHVSWEHDGSNWQSIDDIGNWKIGPVMHPSYAFSLGYYGLSKTLTVDRFNPNNIYGTYGFNGISTDGGKTFKRLSTTQKSNESWRSTGLDNIVGTAIDVNDYNSNTIYMGGTDIGLWVSKNRGDSWQMRIPKQEIYKKYVWDQKYDGGSYDKSGGANVATLISDPSQPSRVWASFSEAQSYGMEKKDENGSSIQYTGLFKSDNYGESWKLITGGDMPENGRIYGLSIVKNSTSPLGNRILYVTVNGHVLKSVDDGETWTQKTPSGVNGVCGLPKVVTVKSGTENGCGLKFTAVDSNNSQIVYAGGESGLWVSEDGGENWCNRGGLAMEANRTREIHMNRDIQPTYNAHNDDENAPYAWEGVFDIKADPKIAKRVYVTVYGAGYEDKGGLYRSVDAGITWQELNLSSASLQGNNPMLHEVDPNRYLRGIAIDPNHSNILFVSSSQAYHSGGDANSSVGILYSEDAGESWNFANNTMAWNYAGMMDIDSTEQNPRIWAWSPGTGLQYTHFLNSSNNGSELKILIPLYSYPNWYSSDYSWKRLIEIKNRYPDAIVVAIVNPSNGHFRNENSDYKRGIEDLVAANIDVVGYVYTQYGNRASNDVVDDIAAWSSIYKKYGVKGIFFDEASTDKNQTAYYSALISEAKNRDLDFTILNPGITTDQAYVDMNEADVIISYEDSDEHRRNTPPQDYNHPSKSTKLSILVHSVNSNNIDELIDFAKAHQFEYIYFTEDGVDGNPWDSTSKYLEDEFKATQ